MRKLALFVALAVGTQIGCSATGPDDQYALLVRLASDTSIPLSDGAQTHLRL
jgi:hypothetical protein